MHCNDECQRIKREFDRYSAEWLIKQDYHINPGNETEDNNSINETISKTDENNEGCKLGEKTNKAQILFVFQIYCIIIFRNIFSIGTL